jgi:hypothetical protein
VFTNCKELLTFKSSGALNGDDVNAYEGLTDNLKSFKLYCIVICNLLCLSISVFMDFIFSWKLLRSKSSNVLDCCVKNFNLASFWVDFLFHSLECVFNCSFIYDTCKRNLLFSACKTFIRMNFSDKMAIEYILSGIDIVPC